MEKDENIRSENCSICGIPLLYPDKPCPKCNPSNNKNLKKNFYKVLTVLSCIGIVFFALFFITLNCFSKSNTGRLPGTSIADNILQRDTLLPVFAHAQSLDERCTDIKVVDTRVSRPLINARQVDGRNVSGDWEELWDVDICGRKVHYPITFVLDETGTTYIIEDINTIKK